VDFKRLGAFHAVAIDDNGELAKNLAFELDLIVSPRDMVHGPFTLTEYIKYVGSDPSYLLAYALDKM
jgi:hypothetical protein